MHSRVFVLAKSVNEIDEVYGSLSEDEIVEAVGADYVSSEDRNEFMESIKWLKDFCSLNIQLEEKQTESGTVLVAVIDTNELMDGLIKEKERRIEKVKEALGREDLHDVAYYAYNQKGFYFYLREAGFLNEIDILDYMDSFGLPDRIYIVQTFDYHF